MKPIALLFLAALSLARAADAPSGPLSLQQVIDQVLLRYPSIEAARAAVDAARGRAIQANAARLPQIGADGGYTYDTLRPYVAIDIPLPGVPPGQIYETVQNAYSVTVTARQLLTDFGRTDAVVAAARSGKIAAEDALEEVRHQLGYQSIQSFYTVLLLRRSVEVDREEIRALEEALRIAENKFGAGSATKFDVLTTRVRLANANNRLTDAQASLHKEENGLRKLLGYGPGTPVELAGDFDPAASAIPRDEAIADGLRDRPEMKQARDQEHTARLTFDAADRGARPTVSAQVQGGVENGQLPSLYDNKGYFTAGVALDVPIFTGRRVSGDRLEASANVRSAQARERELSDAIINDVADAYSDLEAARSRLGTADTLVAQADEALALAKTRYTNGVITNFELLDAQSAARGAELSRLQASYDCVLSRQSVARAAGVAPGP